MLQGSSVISYSIEETLDNEVRLESQLTRQLTYLRRYRSPSALCLKAERLFAFQVDYLVSDDD